MWQRLLRTLRALAYVGILGALFALVAYVAFSQFVRSGATPAPDLFGLNQDDARELLADRGLGLVWSNDEERYDENVPAGHVAAQRPRAGTLVKRGSTIDAFMSRGPQRIEVPSVSGNALQAAQVTLAAAGLRVGRTLDIFTDQGNDGIVVAQQPKVGTRVEPGAPIDLFLSMSGTRETFLMPDLVKRDYDVVRGFFERAGFRLGRVAYVPYGGVRPGTVLRQFPIAGNPLHRGDVIALAVVPLAERPIDAGMAPAPTEPETP